MKEKKFLESTKTLLSTVDLRILRPLRMLTYVLQVKATHFLEKQFSFST